MADDPPIPTDITEFLQMLASGGLGWLIGAALAYVFEEISWFKNRTSQEKRLISIGCSILLPVCAQLLLMYVPGAVWNQVNPFFAVIITAIAGLLGNKREYRGVIKQQPE